MRTIHARLAAVLALAVALAAFAGCGGSSSSDDGGGSDTGSGSDRVRVALVETGPKDDGGWNSAFLRAVNNLRTAAPEADTTIVADVDPGSQGQTTLNTLATQGYELIITNGNFAGDVTKVAPRYPDTKFLVQYDDKASGNRAAYSNADEVGGYLIGMLAGAATRSDVIGYVGNYPIPGSQRVLDAIELGAQSMNRDATIKRLLVNSYYDPTKERQAASALADDGADVLIQDNASPATASVAKQRGLKYVGWSADHSDAAGDAWLGGFLHDWTPILAAAVKRVAADDWDASVMHGVRGERPVELLPFGDAVPQDVREQVDRAYEDMLSGELVIFRGPIVDNGGKVVVPEGQTIEDPRALSGCCSWLVKGIQGQG